MRFLRFHLLTSKHYQAWLLILLALHLVLWTLLPALGLHNLHHSSIELWYESQGSNRLFFRALTLWFNALRELSPSRWFGSANWSFYLLAQLNIVLAVFFFWRLALKLSTANAAFIVALFILFIPHFSVIESQLLLPERLLFAPWAASCLLLWNALSEKRIAPNLATISLWLLCHSLMLHISVQAWALLSAQGLIVLGASLYKKQLYNLIWLSICVLLLLIQSELLEYKIAFAFKITPYSLFLPFEALFVVLITTTMLTIILKLDFWHKPYVILTHFVTLYPASLFVSHFAVLILLNWIAGTIFNDAILFLLRALVPLTLLGLLGQKAGSRIPPNIRQISFGFTSGLFCAMLMVNAFVPREEEAYRQPLPELSAHMEKFWQENNDAPFNLIVAPTSIAQASSYYNNKKYKIINSEDPQKLIQLRDEKQSFIVICTLEKESCRTLPDFFNNNLREAKTRLFNIEAQRKLFALVDKKTYLIAAFSPKTDKKDRTIEREVPVLRLNNLSGKGKPLRLEAPLDGENIQETTQIEFPNL